MFLGACLALLMNESSDEKFSLVYLSRLGIFLERRRSSVLKCVCVLSVCLSIWPSKPLNHALLVLSMKLSAGRIKTPHAPSFPTIIPPM